MGVVSVAQTSGKGILHICSLIFLIYHFCFVCFFFLQHFCVEMCGYQSGWI